MHIAKKHLARGNHPAFVIFAIFFGCVCSDAASGQDPEPEVSWKEWFSGELQLGLEAARSTRDSDIYLDQVLRLKIDPPKRDRWHIRSTLWMIEDLGGRVDPSSALRSLKDASDTAVQARLMSLYLELDDVGGDSTLRLGRQRITDGVVYNRIDGGFYKLRGARWEGYGFAGARASVYRDAHEDLATGAGLSVRLPTKTRMSLDYFYGEDERRSVGTSDIETWITSLSIHQVLTSQHSIFGRATWNETDIDELRLMAQGFFMKSEIVYTLTYHNRLSVLAERVTDVSEFYRVLGEFNRFQDLLAQIDIPIKNRFGLGLQVQVHDSEDAALDSANRDFQRYGLSFDMFELGGHYDVSIFLDYWDLDFGEGQWTVTGEVSREWHQTRGTVGIDYDRFQDRVIDFDPTLQTPIIIESHENIYSFFVKVEHNINEQHRVDVRVLFEDDDGPDSPYWRLRAEYTLSF